MTEQRLSGTHTNTGNHILQPNHLSSCSDIFEAQMFWRYNNRGLQTSNMLPCETARMGNNMNILNHKCSSSLWIATPVCKSEKEVITAWGWGQQIRIGLGVTKLDYRKRLQQHGSVARNFSDRVYDIMNPIKIIAMLSDKVLKVTYYMKNTLIRNEQAFRSNNSTIKKLGVSVQRDLP